MATITPTIVQRSTASGGKDYIVTWSGIGNGSDGQWISIVGAIVRCVTVWGTWGVGGSAKLDASNGNAMSDDKGSAVIVGAQPDEFSLLGPWTANTGVSSNTYTAAASYRPLVTAGDGTTSVNLSLYLVQD